MFKEVPSVKGMSRVNLPGALIKASGEEAAKYVSHLEVISLDSDESSKGDRKNTLEQIKKIISAKNMMEMVSSIEDDEESHVYIEMGDKEGTIRQMVILNVEGKASNPEEINVVSITGDIPVSKVDKMMDSVDDLTF